jgi:hypothetical protein
MLKWFNLRKLFQRLAVFPIMLLRLMVLILLYLQSFLMMKKLKSLLIFWISSSRIRCKRNMKLLMTMMVYLDSMA